jgi:hypothetical protein
MNLFKPVLSFFFIASIVSATCYLPNGQLDPQYEQQVPCGTGSMCCSTNRTSDINTCRSDGTCADAVNEIWRVTCTDKAWGPSCLRLCISGTVTDSNNNPYDLSTTTTPLTVCPDGSYCCGAQNLDCCNQNQGYWVQDLVVYPHSQNPFSTTTSARSSAATSVASSTASTSTSTSTSSSSTESSTSSLTSSVPSAIAIQTSTVSGSIVTYYTLPTSQSDSSKSNSPDSSKTLAIGLGVGIGGALLVLGIVGVLAYIYVNRLRREQQSNRLDSHAHFQFPQHAISEEDITSSSSQKDVHSVAENVELGETIRSPRELWAPDVYYNRDVKQRGSMHFQEMAG